MITREIKNRNIFGHCKTWLVLDCTWGGIKTLEVRKCNGTFSFSSSKNK